MNFISAAALAQKLGVSKTLIIRRAHEGRVKPAPVRLEGKENAPFLFSPKAKIIKQKSFLLLPSAKIIR
jgi:hypothetical protein